MVIYCRGCDQYIGGIDADTATMPDELQEKVNEKVLAHRPACSVYSESREVPA